MPNITTSQVDKDFAKVAKLRQINLVTLVENAQEHTKVSQILNIPSQVANVTKFRQINLATLVESVTLTIKDVHLPLPQFTLFNLKRHGHNSIKKLSVTI